jgi:SAM-dependent methyltransferase
MRLTGVQGGAVLDMPCRPGRHAEVFARHGFAVTGVDLNGKLLERVRSRAAAIEVNVETVRSDMREFCREGEYDLAVSMFNSLGYFEDVREDEKIVRNIYKSLKPGGAALFEMVDREYLKKIFEPVDVTEAPDGSVLTRRLEPVKDFSRIRNDWVLQCDGQTREIRFEQTIFSGEELREIMIRSGFSDIELFGDLAGNRYDDNATRLVAVGRK